MKKEMKKEKKIELKGALKALGIIVLIGMVCVGSAMGYATISHNDFTWSAGGVVFNSTGLYINSTNVVDINAGQTATFIVAASDSLNKERADYVCDGTDDQVEIQAALNAMTKGGKLYLEAGNYYISSSIIMPSVFDITIEGASVGWDNKGAYLILVCNSNCDMFQLNHDSNVFFTKFINFGMSGQAHCNSDSHGFNVTDHVSDITFENLCINYFANDGIHMQLTNRLWNCWISRCLIEGNGGTGIFMDKVQFTWIKDSYVFENLNGVWINDASIMFLSNLHVINTVNHGIVLSGVTYSFLQGSLLNDIDSNSTNLYDGIHVINSSVAILIQGNIVKGDDKARACLYIEDGCSRINVDGNDLADAWGTCKKVFDESTHPTVKIRDNYGYVTRNAGTSTGTGAQQSIPHGLDGNPTKVILWNIEDGANPYQSQTADAWNVYITAVNNTDWGWEAEIV